MLLSEYVLSSIPQEQEALVKELTEVLQRQKTRVNALQKERAELSAQLTSYHPAEQDKLRAEVGTLRERIGELAGLKVLAIMHMAAGLLLP